jgi:hypothetical protein
VAALALPVGAVIGLVAGSQGWAADPRPQLELPRDGFPLHGCPDADGAPAPVSGQVRRGDQLWVVGRGPDGWLAVRDPEDLSGVAWAQSSHLVVADTSALPVLDCATASDAGAFDAGTAPAAAADTPTAPITVPPAPGQPATTANPAVTVPVSVPPGAAPTVPATSVTAGPTLPTLITTTTALPPPPIDTTTSTRPDAADTTPPSVQLVPTANGTVVYSQNSQGCAPIDLEFRLIVGDDSWQARLEDLIWEYPGRNGSIVRGAPTPVGDERYVIGPFAANIPDTRSRCASRPSSTTPRGIAPRRRSPSPSGPTSSTASGSRRDHDHNHRVPPRRDAA